MAKRGLKRGSRSYSAAQKAKMAFKTANGGKSAAQLRKIAQRPDPSVPF